MNRTNQVSASTSLVVGVSVKSRGASCLNLQVTRDVIFTTLFFFLSPRLTIHLLPFVSNQRPVLNQNHSQTRSQTGCPSNSSSLTLTGPSLTKIRTDGYLKCSLPS